MNISDAQKHALERIISDFCLVFLILFGSRARSRDHAESDIDIGYRSKERISLPQLSRIEESLENIFDSKVDLLSLHSENPYFLFSALREAQFLAGDHTAFARFQAYTLALRLDAVHGIDPIRNIFLQKRLTSRD